MNGRKRDLRTVGMGDVAALEGIDLSRDLPVRDRVAVTAMGLLVEAGLDGAKAVPTATIARLAGTTESTMLKHFRTRDEIMTAGIAWSWSEINRHLADKDFAQPAMAPRERLETDFETIWSLYDDPQSRLAVTCAFLSYRRPGLLTSDDKCDAQQAFESRLTSLCAVIVGNEDGIAQLFATYLINYSVAIWFTWAYSERKSDLDFELNSEYAQLGILTQLEMAQNGNFSRLVANPPPLLH